jgi:putative ABC transport system permease protein
MKPRWRKVFLDLFENKGRTLLVVLSIAVGVFSIGVIAGAYVIISNDMSVTYAANNPANIEFRMDNFDDDMLATIRNTRGIADAEGRRVFNCASVPWIVNNGPRWISSRWMISIRTRSTCST